MKEIYYTDTKGYSHTKQSLIDFMWEDEFKRRIKMWELVKQGT